MKNSRTQNAPTRSKRRQSTGAVNRRLIAAALRVWELKHRVR